MFGGADGVPLRGVHHDDAVKSSSLFVDIIGADARPYDGFEAVIALERFCSDFDSTATNSAIVLVESPAEIITFQAGANIKFNVGCVGQQIDTVLRKVVQNDDTKISIHTELLIEILFVF